MRNRAQRYKALAAKQSPGLFLPNASHLEPRVASSNLANKQKRKQDILKNVLLPFGRGDKNIGVKFGLAAGFLPFCTATVLQRRYCCKNCSIDCLIICACAIPSAAHFSRKAEAISLGALIFSYLYLCSTFLWSIRGKLLDIGVCCLCVLLFVVGEYITVGVQRCFYIGVAKALLQHLRWHSALNAAGGVCMPQAVQGYNAGYGRIQHIVFFLRYAEIANSLGWWSVPCDP